MSKWTHRVLVCVPIKTSGKRGPEDLSLRDGSGSEAQGNESCAKVYVDAEY
jgi:hypothetical protein